MRLALAAMTLAVLLSPIFAQAVAKAPVQVNELSLGCPPKYEIEVNPIEVPVGPGGIKIGAPAKQRGLPDYVCPLPK